MVRGIAKAAWSRARSGELAADRACLVALAASWLGLCAAHAQPADRATQTGTGQTASGQNLTPPMDAAPTAAAGDHSDSDAGPPRATARIVSELTTLVPGRVNMVGVRFSIDPEWHLYTNGYNDTGFAPKLEWTLPVGFEALDPIFPAGHRYVAAGDLLDHIYEHDVLVIVPIRVAFGQRPGSDVQFAAKATWLVCSSVCELEEAELRATLKIAGATDALLASADADAFAATRAMAPAYLPPVAEAKGVEVSVSQRTLRVSAPAAQRLVFYPDAPGDGVMIAEELVTNGSVDAGRMQLRFRPAPSEAGGPAADHVIRGVLEVVHRPDAASVAEPPTGSGSHSGGAAAGASSSLYRVDLRVTD